MGVFEFIIIIVVISTLGKVAISVGGPLVDKLGDLAGEVARSKKAERQGAVLEPEVVEELEKRLARIEDRLDFLEELKAPSRSRALGGGLDRGADRRGATGPARRDTTADEPAAGDA